MVYLSVDSYLFWWPVVSSQTLLYTVVIVLNMSFSIIHDKCDYYRENVYVIVIKKMSKL